MNPFLAYAASLHPIADPLALTVKSIINPKRESVNVRESNPLSHFHGHHPRTAMKAIDAPVPGFGGESHNNIMTSWPKAGNLKAWGPDLFA
jgi:hypothetical protein